MSIDYNSKKYETESLRNRRVYSFKSVGETVSTMKAIEDSVETIALPIGIKTPIAFGNGSSLFAMHKDMGQQVSDNLRNLLQTNHGERLGLFDFGANLGELVFEFGNENFEVEAISRIKRSVSKYMPYVKLETFESFTDHNDNKEVAKVAMKVTYRIPRIDARLRSLEVMLYIGG
ncbi:MAG: hypothetical protein CBC29_05765 [Methylococcaceae bacterium TMED69]|nr:MAG: hypothetical protein CBC29_05765 [Methylococcaceae bacterium TMED69]|tara:strand:+ start:314 stop:838 length:525 start_codon:yes stop_codon:yes gene_type:complete